MCGSFRPAPPPVSIGIPAHASDRFLGRFLLVCAVVLGLASLESYTRTGALFSEAWNALSVLFLFGVVLLLIWEHRLPLRVLRRIWRALPPGYVLVLSLAYAGFSGVPAEAPSPWLWFMELPILCLLTLVARPALAVAGSFVSAAAPLCSAFFFLGVAPSTVAAAAALHAGNAAVVMLFVFVRQRLILLHRAQNRARAQQRGEARATVHTERLQSFALAVHDELLATLSSALRFSGSPPETLRQSARRALERLDDPPRSWRPSAPDSDPAAQFVSMGIAVIAIARMVLASAPEAKTLTRAGTGTAPKHAVIVLGLAAAEAARNAMRHAGSCEVGIEAEDRRIRVTASDQGPGFDPGAVPPERLGVTGGIYGRMRALPGGEASIRSGPGGTEVELTWRG